MKKADFDNNVTFCAPLDSFLQIVGLPVKVFNR